MVLQATSGAIVVSGSSLMPRPWALIHFEALVPLCTHFMWRFRAFVPHVCAEFSSCNTGVLAANSHATLSILGIILQSIQCCGLSRSLELPTRKGLSFGAKILMRSRSWAHARVTPGSFSGLGPSLLWRPRREVPSRVLPGLCPLANVVKVAARVRGLHAQLPSLCPLLPLPEDGADVAGALNALPDAIYAVFCTPHVSGFFRISSGAGRWALTYRGAGGVQG